MIVSYDAQYAISLMRGDDLIWRSMYGTVSTLEEAQETRQDWVSKYPDAVTRIWKTIGEEVKA